MSGLVGGGRGGGGGGGGGLPTCLSIHDVESGWLFFLWTVEFGGWVGGWVGGLSLSQLGVESWVGGWNFWVGLGGWVGGWVVCLFFTHTCARSHPYTPHLCREKEEENDHEREGEREGGWVGGWVGGS